jgi:hypothetical protein
LVVFFVFCPLGSRWVARYLPFETGLAPNDFQRVETPVVSRFWSEIKRQYIIVPIDRY